MAKNHKAKERIRQAKPVSALSHKAKRRIFACGEERKPEEMNVPHESFYKVLVKSFGLENVSRWHSGDLTRYLIWIFSGTVILITILMLVYI
jgi:hypothetical protein